ncbi:hypothetical protein BpHYR1_050779 [Brachionus plicatilis]|uniref:Uncharacterized protein n=1 Tax=Brachionus plicatilis TaxID=10195 RepID=A0A3M7PWQ2_BRAPC|nr:hypothetical protein BpHYR1_050779 [Brachionus plicatilis]
MEICLEQIKSGVVFTRDPREVKKDEFINKLLNELFLSNAINLHFGEYIVIRLIESKNNETITKKTLFGWLCHA